VQDERLYKGLREQQTDTQHWGFMSDLGFEDECKSDITKAQIDWEAPPASQGQDDAKSPVCWRQGWYRQAVAMPSAWSGRRVLLCVEGPTVDLVDVYVDGEKISAGRRLFGTSQFDVSAHMRPGGPSVIILHIKAACEAFVQPDARAQSVSRHERVQLIRGVYLECTSLVAIARASLQAISSEEHMARGQAVVGIVHSGSDPAALTILVDVEAPTGQSVIAEAHVTVQPGTTCEQAIFVPIRQPKWWRHDDPVRYQVIVTLFDDERGPIDDLHFLTGLQLL